MSQNRSIQRRCLREVHRRADRALLGDERRISKVADHAQIRFTSPRPHRVSSLWPRHFIPVSTYRCARHVTSASAVSIGTDNACGCIDHCDRAVFEHERVDVIGDRRRGRTSRADTAGDHDEDQTIAPSLIDGLQLTRYGWITQWLVMAVCEQMAFTNWAIACSGRWRAISASLTIPTKRWLSITGNLRI